MSHEQKNGKISDALDSLLFVRATRLGMAALVLIAPTVGTWIVKDLNEASAAMQRFVLVVEPKVDELGKDMKVIGENVTQLKVDTSSLKARQDSTDTMIKYFDIRDKR